MRLSGAASGPWPELKILPWSARIQDDGRADMLQRSIRRTRMAIAVSEPLNVSRSNDAVVRHMYVKWSSTAAHWGSAPMLYHFIPLRLKEKEEIKIHSCVGKITARADDD